MLMAYWCNQMAFINFGVHRLSLPSSRYTKSTCERSRTSTPLRMSRTRIGHGFDLHRLEPGLPLILGGVKLQHDRGCAGHSDGDAVYHCVVDSVLGALSLPDIGQVFPDTDPRFKDCNSHVFMSAAYDQMHQKGYQVGNIDVTVILEKPKMAPYKAEIRMNIAELLKTDIENVNLKAKTNEKVDAVGENRAVSVHAVALLIPREEARRSVANEATSSTFTPASITVDLMSKIDKRVSAIQGITLSSKPTECAVQKLFDTVQDRRDADPSSSWTAKLFNEGHKKIAQKVGEEAVEVAIEGSVRNSSGVIKESADLLYHLTVLWAELDIKPDDVWTELAQREGTSGIEEKASRS